MSQFYCPLNEVVYILKRVIFSFVIRPGTNEQLYEKEFNLKFINWALLPAFITDIFFFFLSWKGGER